MKEYIGLCYRCEHRALYNETQDHTPRYECGCPSQSVVSCYMYQPVKSLIMARNKGDKRPLFGPQMISARSHAIGIAKGEYQVIKQGKGFALFYMPEKSHKSLKTSVKPLDCIGIDTNKHTNMGQKGKIDIK